MYIKVNKQYKQPHNNKLIDCCH